MRLRLLVLVACAFAALLAAPATAYKVRQMPLPDATVGKSYRFQFQTDGGSAPHTFRMFAGGLPAGLSFSESGSITGTPRESGSFGFWIEAVDRSGSKTQRRFVLGVKPGSTNTGSPGGAPLPPPIPASPLSIRPDSIAPAAVGIPYRTTLRVYGGAVRTWAIESGALPPGLAFADGVVQGTPTTVGAATLVIVASDGARSARTTLTIRVAGPMQVRVPLIATIVVGESYSVQATVTGGAPPFRWSLEGDTGGQVGIVPQAGTIGGAGRAPGSPRFRVVVTDAAGQRRSTGARLTVVPFPAVASTGLPAPTAGSAYRARLTVTGGLAPFRWRALATLPPWLALDDRTGVVRGLVPAVSPALRIGFEVTDVRGNIASASLVLPAAR
jgi:hypothetical protein